MGTFKIDINSDVGEGMENEEQLFPLITSCNIACGGHAGDTQSMNTVVKLAVLNKVNIGAHPSYPDIENFGRLSMSINDTELIASVQSQIERLKSISEFYGTNLSHIKAHGALYNDIAKDDKLADVFLQAILPYRSLVLYVPYQSIISEKALKLGCNIKYEAFADRNYNDDGSLVSRKLPNAVLHNKKIVFQHVKNMILNESIVTINSDKIETKAETLCVHGDTKEALELLLYLNQKLPEVGIRITND